MEEIHFLDDLQLAYAEAIDRMTSEWVHDDDGGVNHEQTGTRKTMIFGEVMLIFQPIGKEDEWHDDAAIIIAPKKDSKFKITENIFEKARIRFQLAENKFIESYNEFVTSYGFWISNIQNPTFNRLLNIKKELHFEDGRLKMKYEIGCYINEPICRWSGRILRNWIYSLSAFERHRIEEFKEFRKNHEENIKYIEDEIKIMEKELPSIPNQLHYISVEENLKNYNQVKDERLAYFLKQEEKLKKPLQFGDIDGTSGEWQVKEYMEQMLSREDEIDEALKNSKTLPILTLEEAFPNRIKPKIFLKISIPGKTKTLTGNKRERE